MEKLTKQQLTFSTPEELDQLARANTTCLGCGQPKEKGLVVCWHCFKYTGVKVPFKEYYGDIKQWAALFSYLLNQ